MKTKPLVTVIVSVYNHADYIGQTIKSIVEQDYGLENIELIVFDDCSTDMSPILVQSLAGQYRFKAILNNKNQGLCANLNQALTMAQGKYICITGSDDKWEQKKLSKQVAYMEKHSTAAVLSGNVIKIDADDKPLADIKQKHSPSRIYSFREVILRDFPFSTTMAMIRQKALSEVGHYDESLKIEDYYMWLKMTNAGHEIHFMDEILGYYRIHGTNSIHRSWVIYSEMKKILEAYKDDPIYPQAIKRLKQVYFPQIAKIKKWKALQMLPDAISNSRFFYRGLFYLLTPKFILS